MESEFVGLSEIADIAGVTRQAVTNWRKRFDDFPKPTQTLQSGPVWNRDEAELWLKHHRRLSRADQRNSRTMQRAQTLTKLFKQVADLVATEAERNPAFATKLDAILAPLPQKAAGKSKAKAPPAPDVFAEFEAKGAEEFSFWLRSLDVPTLKAIVKANGFDPGKKSTRWKEAGKFAPFILAQVQARIKRGSAFLTPSDHA